MCSFTFGLGWVLNYLGIINATTAKLVNILMRGLRYLSLKAQLDANTGDPFSLQESCFNSLLLGLGLWED